MLQSRLRSGITIINKKRLGLNWELGKRYASEESAVDPAVHSSHPQGQAIKEALETNEATRAPRTADEPDPLVSSPMKPSSRLGQPSEPNTQQKRQLSTNQSHAQAQKAQKKAEQDNKEYYKHHKASPLSGVELADTRKPVSQATDSPGKDQGIMLWKPEQLESAEDTLMRAVKMWNWNKMRGDPDSPHGRVLRELRGEDW